MAVTTVRRSRPGYLAACPSPRDGPPNSPADTARPRYPQQAGPGHAEHADSEPDAPALAAITVIAPNPTSGTTTTPTPPPLTAPSAMSAGETADSRPIGCKTASHSAARRLHT